MPFKDFYDVICEARGIKRENACEKCGTREYFIEKQGYGKFCESCAEKEKEKWING